MYISTENFHSGARRITHYVTALALNSRTNCTGATNPFAFRGNKKIATVETGKIIQKVGV